jgi:hypothetical protein
MFKGGLMCVCVKIPTALRGSRFVSLWPRAARIRVKELPASVMKLRVAPSPWNLEWYLLHLPKVAARTEILTQACQPVHAGQDFRLVYAEIPKDPSRNNVSLSSDRIS